MARKSKVTGITLECGNDMWKREKRQYEETIHFHRELRTHVYKVKRLDHARIKKILRQADSNYLFFGVESVLLQYYYEYKFYDKKWFRKFVNIFYYGWIFTWFSIMIYYWVVEKFLGD